MYPLNVFFFSFKLFLFVSNRERERKGASARENDRMSERDGMGGIEGEKKNVWRWKICKRSREHLTGSFFSIVYSLLVVAVGFFLVFHCFAQQTFAQYRLIHLTHSTFWMQRKWTCHMCMLDRTSKRVQMKETKNKKKWKTCHLSSQKDKNEKNKAAKLDIRAPLEFYSLKNTSRYREPSSNMQFFLHRHLQRNNQNVNSWMWQ